jgi:mycoredoxin
VLLWVTPANDEGIPVSAPLTMYTTRWCGFCRRLKSQLASDGIELAEVDIEAEPGAAEFVMRVNGGNRTVPTVVIDADPPIVLVNPSAREVERHMADLAGR